MIKYRINSSGNGYHWRTKSLCEIGISPGHSVHKGDKLHSLIDWASNNFEACLITLSDSLYKYNYMADGHDTNTSYTKSLELGDKWLASNMSIIRQYKDFVYKVFRWDECINQPAFSTTYDLLQLYYQDDNGFKEAIDKDVKVFTKRQMKNNSELDIKLLQDNSRNFLIEEAAYYILTGRKYSPARLYPAEDNNTFQYLRLDKTPFELKGFENSPHVRVVLNRKPSMFTKVA